MGRLPVLAEARQTHGGTDQKLIRHTQREPFSGVSKPEPLKHALSGFWSRELQKNIASLADSWVATRS